MTTENRKWPLVVLTVFVIIAGAGVGGYFGYGAGEYYASFHNMQVDVQARFESQYKIKDTSIVYTQPHETLPEWLRHECHRERWGSYGTVLGSAGGASVGWLWTILVWRQRQHGGLRIVASAVGWGIAAGLLCTVFLHAGLWTVVLDNDGAPFLVGLILGGVAGALAGLVCGFAAWGVAARGRRKDALVAEQPAGTRPDEARRNAQDGA
ncbi:MAG: hypothetical protein IMZ44_08505 [Planctomycetes bacterium]|nr:hypothetical protein [Planctomycetota bacterium]